MDSTTRTWFHLSRHEDPPADPDPAGDPGPEGAPDPEPEVDVSDPRVKEVLRRERSARVAAEKAAAKSGKEAREAAARIKEFEDRDKTEQQKLEDRAAAAEKAAEEATTKALRAEVALDKGLPKALAARLQGSTLEEMQADADALLALVPTAPSAPPTAPPPAAAGVGAQGTPPAPADFRSADPADVKAELRRLGVRNT